MIDKKIDDYGRVVIDDPNSIVELMFKGINPSTVFVNESEQFNEFNRWCDHFDKKDYALNFVHDEHSSEEEHKERSSHWLISDDMKRIDVRSFLLELCHSDEQKDRVNYEMDLYEERDLIPLLQLMMFLVDHFRRNNLMWGVGRGSSVASYVLYLIGVHKIDSIKFGLDASDFLK